MSHPDAVPTRDAVGAEFACPLVHGCDRPSECWPAGTCLWQRGQDARYASDAKGKPRTKAPQAIRKKLLMVRECYSCEHPASDGHHVVFRSHGGDDVIENIAPLCHHCHTLLHYDTSEEAIEVRRSIGKTLVERDQDVIVYVLTKLGVNPGQEFLRRYYYCGAPARLVKEMRAAEATQRMGA